MGKTKNTQPTVTYAVSWLSEGNDENSAGIYPYNFTTRKKAESYLKECLANEANDMQNNYDNVVVDEAAGVVHDKYFNEIVRLKISEITLKN